MPTLPLFSMPTAAQPPVSNVAISNKLSQQTSENDSSQMMTIQANALNISPEFNQSFDDSNPFLQSLMAAFILPQGQGMAAFNKEAELAIDNMQLDSEVDVAMIADTASQYIDPVLSPWQIQNQTISRPELGLSLEQINQQRNAKPEVSSAGSVLTTNLSGAKDMQPQLQTTPDDVSSSLNPVAVAVDVTVNSQPMLNKVGLMSKELPDSAVNLTDTAVDPLDGFSQLNDDINIHEKPLTLMAAKPEVTASAVIEETVSSGLDSLVDKDSMLNMGLSEDKKIKQMAELTERKIEHEGGPKNFKLDVPPNDPKWTEQIAKRISIMSSDQLQTARIQLDPPELGSLDVKIRIHHEQMSVAFSSNQPQVREALESQSPRLREMMEQQGINLVDVNVSSQQQGGGSNASAQELGDDGFLTEDSNIEQAEITQLESDSLVDYFA